MNSPDSPFNVFVLPERESVSEYKIDRVINYGTYGMILNVEDRPLALKINYVTDGWFGVFSWKEASILRSIQHPNVIQLRDFKIQDGDQEIHDAPIDDLETMVKQIDYDGMHRDPLCYILDKGGDNLENVTQSKSHGMEHEEVMDQLCEGLNYLHEELKVCHLDMKSNNVIKFEVDEKPVYRICDFGFSRPIGANEYCGFDIMHPIYRSPELLFVINDRVTPELDMWCLGIVWFEMLEGLIDFNRNPFPKHLELFNESHSGGQKVSPKVIAKLPADVLNQMYNVLCLSNITEEDLEYIQKGRRPGLKTVLRVWRWCKSRGLIKPYEIKNQRLSGMLQVDPSKRTLGVKSMSVDEEKDLGPYRVSEPGDHRGDHLLYISDLPPFTTSELDRVSVYGHYLYHYIGYHRDFYDHLKDNVEFEPRHLVMTCWYIAKKFNSILEYPVPLEVSVQDREVMEKLEVHIGRYSKMALPLHMIYNFMNDMKSRPRDIARTVYMLSLMKPGRYSMNTLGPIFDEFNDRREELLPTNYLSVMVDTKILSKTTRRLSEAALGMLDEYCDRFHDRVKEAILS